MVRHWNKIIEQSRSQRHRSIRRSQTINFVGAVITALVLLIVIYSKFLNGAWLAMTAMVVIFIVMRTMKSHYLKVSHELEIPPDHLTALPSRNHGIVLVSRLHLPTMRALAYARSTRPSDLVALTVQVDEKTTRALQDEWFRRGITVPLVVVGSPYRETTKPIMDYIRQLRRQSSRDIVTVFIPEYVVGHWWEHVLHNQTALRLKAASCSFQASWSPACHGNWNPPTHAPSDTTGPDPNERLPDWPAPTPPPTSHPPARTLSSDTRLKRRKNCDGPPSLGDVAT